MAQIFISYARKDHFFVDRLREDFRRAGINYWIDDEGLSPGTRNWERAIRKAIAESDAMLWIVSPAAYESEYVSSELAVGEMHRLRIYPVFADGDNWVACVPLGKHNIQFVDMRHDKYRSGLADLLRALRGDSPEIAVPEPETPALPHDAEPRNPYKGLLAFTEADTGDFYGRDALVATLQRRLADRLEAKKDRFLAVLGPSGAGKSSVVMAGLIPALKKAHAAWAFLPRIVPGKKPLEALADALYSALPQTSLVALENDLKSPGGRMLHRLAQQIGAAQVLLYIDQFEELFTLTEDEAERQQFISLITQAVTEADGRLIVLLSMRADFYGHPLNYPQLGRLVEASNVGVLPMSIPELRDAIEKPARLPDVALTFEDGLVAEIIFALRERGKALASALPLLQFTLARLFAERDGTRLTFAAYGAMGGVEGAIGAHCEAVFSALPQAAQEKLGSVFLPLTSFDEESGEPTRRRAPLESMAGDEGVRLLVDALVDERLLQTGRDEDGRYLEVAHEALFHTWKRLALWIETTRGDLRLLRQVERDAAEWDAGGRTYLLPAERLRSIHEALERLGVKARLDPSVHDFIYPQAMLLQELEKPETSEPRRLRISDDLALLGDPREGVGVKDGVPDIAWQAVEGSGGKVTFAFGKFKVETFFIAKYQVTYAQYQAFVEADDGFYAENAPWWNEMPEEYKQQELAQQRTKNANNPRDSVSWYQSVAFARWLNQRLRGLTLAATLASSAEMPDRAGPVPTLVVGENAEVRLPTEWEWQWAAQGGAAAKDYPWGSWKPGCANTSESGLGRAAAVGMYPHSAADCGALDMAGNLWEWCLNDRDNPEITDGYGNGNSKVLRGGSFSNLQGNAAASVRDDLGYPYSRFGLYGLRLAACPISAL